MKKTIFTILIVIWIGCFAQSTKSKMQEAFRELEEEKLTLYFGDALTGKPIEKAVIEIKNIGKFQTNLRGEVYFPIPENDGYYQVKFSKEGYITSEFEIEIMVGSIFFNRFSVSPRMPLEYVRIVLDWGEKPADLDIHLLKKGNYHISYRNMNVSEDGEAKLDRDDTTSYGPETITINKIDENTEYICFIHNYSDRNDENNDNLSNSKAAVSVFGDDNKLLKHYNIERRKTGNYWLAFKIINGEIQKIDNIREQIGNFDD